MHIFSLQAMKIRTNSHCSRLPRESAVFLCTVFMHSAPSTFYGAQHHTSPVTTTIHRRFASILRHPRFETSRNHLETSSERNRNDQRSQEGSLLRRHPTRLRAVGVRHQPDRWRQFRRILRYPPCRADLHRHQGMLAYLPAPLSREGALAAETPRTRIFSPHEF